jgi:3-deoxy-D-arabino-heptulosonate 7-phosphate (DAHP) synthase class II
MTPWTPETWQAKPAKQLPAYPDSTALARAVETLRRYPPLVFAGESRSLKAQLAKAAKGFNIICAHFDLQVYRGSRFKHPRFRGGRQFV